MLLLLYLFVLFVVAVVVVVTIIEINVVILFSLCCVCCSCRIGADSSRVCYRFVVFATDDDPSFFLFILLLQFSMIY